MASFGLKSNRRLSTCHPTLQLIFRRAVLDFDCTIIQGHRHQEAQTKAYNSGTSTVKWPDSKHNSTPSMAVDCGPWVRGTGMPWKDIPQICYFAGYVMRLAEQMFLDGEIDYLLRWGGDWNSNRLIRDQKLMDYTHFELINSGSNYASFERKRDKQQLIEPMTGESR